MIEKSEMVYDSSPSLETLSSQSIVLCSAHLANLVYSLTESTSDIITRVVIQVKTIIGWHMHKYVWHMHKYVW